MKKDVVEDYGTHKYNRTYEKCDLFCPNCGKQEVWEELGSGDYYQGVTYLCIACNNSHSLDNTCCEFDKDSVNYSVVRQILGGKMKVDILDLDIDFLKCFELIPNTDSRLRQLGDRFQLLGIDKPSIFKLIFLVSIFTRNLLFKSINNPASIKVLRIINDEKLSNPTGSVPKCHLPNKPVL